MKEIGLINPKTQYQNIILMKKLGIGIGKTTYMMIKTLLIFILLTTPAFAYTDEEIANSIFKAEGGENATYLYGIRSVPYKDKAEARQICLNTIRNNRIRFKKQTKYTDYLEFLASRYAPTQGKDLTKQEKAVNIYWLKNVKFFLQNN